MYGLPANAALVGEQITYPSQECCSCGADLIKAAGLADGL